MKKTRQESAKLMKEVKEEQIIDNDKLENYCSLMEKIFSKINEEETEYFKKKFLNVFLINAIDSLHLDVASAIAGLELTKFSILNNVCTSFDETFEEQNNPYIG